MTRSKIIRFIYSGNRTTLYNDRLPLLKKYKFRSDIFNKLNKELDISHVKWFENMLLDNSERPAFLL